MWYLTLVLILVPGIVRAQPSLQARIGAATPGDTLVVDGGRYAGPLVIDRPLVLRGRNNPILEGDEKTHVVTIQAPRVALVGFTVRGSGTRLEDDHAGILVRADSAVIRDNHLRDVLHGIYVQGADHARITGNDITGPPYRTRHLAPDEARRYGCTVPPDGGPCDVPLPSNQRGNGIHLWKSVGNTVAQNTIAQTRDGIYFSFADNTSATGNTIHDVRYGLHYMYSDGNLFKRNTFYGNASGSAIMYSSDLTAHTNTFRDNRTHRGYGLLVQSVEDAVFVQNQLTENGTGLYLENSTRNTFRQNVIAANYRGLRMTGSSTNNRFSANVIRGNLQTAAVAGVSATNVWQIDGVGNYWGPRGLLDLDGDGISELPHRTVDVVGQRRETFPYVGLLAGSPGLALLSEALRRVSIPGVPTLTDDRPLMRPPAVLDEVAGDVDSAFVLALLIGAAGIILLRRYRHD